jgi:transposase
MAGRKPYTREFKVETVKLVTEQGMKRSQVARDMGIDVQTLRRWIHELATDGERAFPGPGYPRDEELVRLRRENEQLRQEREILKKALGIFSRMPE